MRIAACLITKGDSELDKLKNAVGSIKPWVESVHILANWEHKKTEKWCKDNAIDFRFLPWNKNYSEQRNANFTMVPKDVDYIFWADSDDILVGGKWLKNVAQIAKNKDIQCVFMDYWYSCLFDGEPVFKNLVDIDMTHSRERLIKPGVMNWKKRIHETPVPIEGVKYDASVIHYHKENMPIAVMHTTAQMADKDGNIERTLRNKEILELELEDERKEGKPDPRTILYLMKIYKELAHPERAKMNLELGKEYLELSGWDEERATCCLIISHSCQVLGDWQQADDYAHLALQEYPDRLETMLRLSECAFELKNYRSMKFWLDKALAHNEDKDTASVDNTFWNKYLAAELTCRYFYYVKRNLRKAYKAAQEVYDLHPTEDTEKRMLELENYANLDIACEHTDKLCQYLSLQGDEKAVLRVLQCLPQAIQLQPFAINLRQKYSSPRIWSKNEICYFANFGGQALEPWSPRNLEKGIGGSETAVIELAKEWVKMGWKVTVYGDPGSDQGLHDGVEYLPYFYFNKKDKFNIFIQWRNGGLVNQISSKKFYIDLHDVVKSAAFTDLDGIDGIMVKSEAHRKLLKNIPDDKVIIISNGIRL